MTSRILPLAALLAALAGVSTWAMTAGGRGNVPAGDYTPRPHQTIVISGAERDTLLARAATHFTIADHHGPWPDVVACRYLKDHPSGTTPKFDCVVDGGEVIKVKYGSNPEIQAEAAATRLLSRLGFAADRVDVVRKVRCYGCPRFPFLTMQLLSLAPAADRLGDRGIDGGYTDFDWVGVERKFPAPAIETSSVKGWAWYELRQSQAPRAEIDALRLLAIFLAHWDNKSENQRLVCVDAHPGPSCERPIAMIQDVGATFGPMKVNLTEWPAQPVWADRATCEVSMRRLPYGGATFTDERISEEGRALLAGALAQLTDEDVRNMFREAHFPEYQASTDDRRDLAAWTEAFRQRRDQILNAGPCPRATSPAAPPSRP